MVILLTQSPHSYRSEEGETEKKRKRKWTMSRALLERVWAIHHVDVDDCYHTTEGTDLEW